MHNVFAQHPESNWKQLRRSLTFYPVILPHIILFSLLLSLIAFTPRIVSIIHPLVLPPFSPYRLLYLVIDLLALLMLTATLERIYRMLAKQPGGLASDFKLAARKLPLIFVAMLLQMLLVLLVYIVFLLLIFRFKYVSLMAFPWGLLLLGVGFIVPVMFFVFIYILFYFYLPLIVLENKGVFAALKKSACLVWHHWWPTFWLQSTPWITYLLTLMLIKFALNIPIHIYFFDPGYRGLLLPTILHIVIFALFIPWIVSVLLLQLHDLELRRSGRLK